jgi:hypothetical protein
MTGTTLNAERESRGFKGVLTSDQVAEIIRDLRKEATEAEQ